MRVVNFLVYALLKGFLQIGRYTPMSITFRGMRLLARLVYSLVKGRRALMLWNLEYALGDSITPARREEIARKSFENIFVAMAELLHMDQIDDHWQDHFEFEGAEVIERMLKAKRGFFVFGGHFGGWTMPQAIRMRFPEIPYFNMVARPLRNPYLQNLLEYLGAKLGGRVISSRGTGARIEEAVARGELVGFYMDQESRRGQGIFVKFFGREASSHVVPGYLAWKNNIPIIPYWIFRTRPGRFKIVFREPLAYEISADTDENNRRLTQLIADEVERTIKADPDQWLWAHNRWRRRADGTKVEVFAKRKKRKRTAARRRGDYLSSEDQRKDAGNGA